MVLLNWSLKLHFSNVYAVLPPMHAVTSTGGKDDLGEEIQAEFLRIKKMNDNPSLEPTDAPEDPNLRCGYCGKCFQLGQIQHYKKHVSRSCPAAPPFPSGRPLPQQEIEGFIDGLMSQGCEVKEVYEYILHVQSCYNQRFGEHSSM